MARAIESTTTFIVSPDEIGPDAFVLTGEEAEHARRVLRARPGDSIRAVDGAGTIVSGSVIEVSGKRVVVSLLSRVAAPEDPADNVTVAVGILKQRNRLEWLIEKLVELGIGRLQLVRTGRSLPGGDNPARFDRVVRAASKQSGRSRFMRVEIQDGIEQAGGFDRSSSRVVCHADQGATGLLRTLEVVGAGSDTTLWVGPEGGFTGEELGRFADSGAEFAHLGSIRLRAETAAVAAAAVLRAVQENKNET